MNRQGFSLTELLVVMGMTSVILPIGVGIVHRLMHEQKSAERDNAMHRVAQRLSMQLREDVHRANRAELIQSEDRNEQELVLELPDERSVTYAVRGNVLLWTSVREGEPVHRDSYAFPDNYRLQFFDVSEQRVTFTAFALAQTHLATSHGKSSSDESLSDESFSDGRRAVMHVEAAVGRDHRFLNETREPTEP